MCDDVPSISGVEFSAFAAGQATVWLQLRGAPVVHSTFGQGEIMSVTDRQKSPPLIVIRFNENGDKTFNTDGFAKGVFPKLFIPEHLATSVSEWRRRREADEAALEHFRRLATKYKIPVLNIKLSPVVPILHKLESTEPLSTTDVSWLETNGLFDVLATYFNRCYLAGRDEWDLVKACRYLRRAGLPEKVLELTARFPHDQPNLPRKTMSALLTTRGGAYRDIGDLGSARQMAEQAIRTQESQYPYSLLGAICYAEGKPEEGDRHFEVAGTFGGSATVRDTEIRAVLQESAAEIQTKIAKYLIEKDPEKYAWATRFVHLNGRGHR